MFKFFKIRLNFQIKTENKNNQIFYLIFLNIPLKN